MTEIKSGAPEVRAPFYSHLSYDIVPDAEAIRLPLRAKAVRVLRGGPVETGRGFVLHSSDYGANDSTVKIGDVCLTATLDILRAIAKMRESRGDSAR